MKDFPCFATDDGVASLILKEIPYRQEAYIRFQDVQPGRLAPFLEECVSFCRMAGAEKIYAQGHRELARYPPTPPFMKCGARRGWTRRCWRTSFR